MSSQICQTRNGSAPSSGPTPRCREARRSRPSRRLAETFLGSSTQRCSRDGPPSMSWMSMSAKCWIAFAGRAGADPDVVGHVGQRHEPVAAHPERRPLRRASRPRSRSASGSSSSARPGRPTSLRRRPSSRWRSGRSFPSIRRAPCSSRARSRRRARGRCVERNAAEREGALDPSVGRRTRSPPHCMRDRPQAPRADARAPAARCPGLRPSSSAGRGRLHGRVVEPERARIARPRERICRSVEPLRDAAVRACAGGRRESSDVGRVVEPAQRLDSGRTAPGSRLRSRRSCRRTRAPGTRSGRA